MAAAGGRRASAAVRAPVSWRERDAVQAARAVDSARMGRPLSMADWLVMLSRERLAGATADAALPEYLRDRAKRAVESLDADATEARRAPGRPPVLY